MKKVNPSNFPSVLSIGGIDPSGGAGIFMDVQAANLAGVHPFAVATVSTIQDGQQFLGAFPQDVETIDRSIQLILDGFAVGAVKTGALGTAEIVRCVADLATQPDFPNLIIDPVVYSSSQGALLSPDALDILRTVLMNKAALITPNRMEAEMLSGITIHNLEDMKRASTRLIELGVNAVLIKGGHVNGDKITDLLVETNGEVTIYEKPRHENSDVRGTGCALASLIAAFIAKGHVLSDAVAQAEQLLGQGIEHAVLLSNGNPRVLRFFGE